MMKTKTALGLALMALTAACDATMYRDSGTPAPGGYGNSVSQNNAVMIIDPQPASAANTQIDLDGRRAGIGIERYRQNKVIPPIEMETSDVLQ